MQGRRQTPMVPRFGRRSRSQVSTIAPSGFPDLAKPPTIFRKRMPPAKPRLPAVLQEQPHVAVFFIRGWLFVLGLLNDHSTMKGQRPTGGIVQAESSGIETANYQLAWM